MRQKQPPYTFIWIIALTSINQRGHDRGNTCIDHILIHQPDKLFGIVGGLGNDYLQCPCHVGLVGELLTLPPREATREV